jgi:hypothetical protein
MKKLVILMLMVFLVGACTPKEQTQIEKQDSAPETSSQIATIPSEKTSNQATLSTSEETIRWVTAGLGDWEDESNWEDLSSKTRRLPNEQDIVFIPKMLQGRTVSVQITDSAAKIVRKLVNEGTIVGHRNEKNSQGAVALHATEALFNRGLMQGEADPNGEGGSVTINTAKLENTGTIEAGETNGIEAAGGSITITAEQLLNKGDIRSGHSEKGDGGSIQIHGNRLTNYKRITAGNTSQAGRAGGSVLITASEYFSQYESSRITGGKSAEKREAAPPSSDKDKKKELPKITYLGRGGDITIKAAEINIFDGRLTGGEGAPRGDLVLEATAGLVVSGNKPRLEGQLLKLTARKSLSLLGLRKEALKSVADPDQIGIFISSCERIDLQNNKESVILASTSGAIVQLAVPEASRKKILLDASVKLEKLSKPTVQIVASVQTCAP